MPLSVMATAGYLRRYPASHLSQADWVYLASAVEKTNKKSSVSGLCGAPGDLFPVKAGFLQKILIILDCIKACVGKTTLKKQQKRPQNLQELFWFS